MKTLFQRFRYKRSLFLLLLLFITVGFFLAGRSAFAGSNKPDKEQIKGILIGLNQLEKDIKNTPNADMDKTRKKIYLEKVDLIEKQLKDENVCSALKAINRLLERYTEFQVRGIVKNIDAIFNETTQLQGDIVAALPKGKECPYAQGLGGDASLNIGDSDNKTFAATVDFGAPKFTTVKGNGETFTRVHFDENQIDEMTGDPGQPAVPVWRSLIAVPIGGEAVLGDVAVKAGKKLSLNLVPFQEQPIDQENPELVPSKPPIDIFRDKPFTKNEDAYASDVALPPDPCKITMLGQARDLNIAQVECATGKYNPKSDSLELYDSLSFKVNFTGGANFITKHTQNPFEKENEIVMSSVLNKAVLNRYVAEVIFTPICFGEENMILTNQAMKPAADKLAAWKNTKGIVTNVFVIGAGRTAASVDAFIESRYDRCLTRPSYVTILGDAEIIAPFYVSTSGSPTTGTDYPYSRYKTGTLPFFSVGRIPVDDLTQANTYVDKVIAYEKTPPNGFTNPNFYSRAMIAGQFQCCRTDVGANGTDQRTFAEVSEFGRNVLVANGKSVDRVYKETVDGSYSPRDPLPRRWFDGTAIPVGSGVEPGSGFAWNGTTGQVVSNWNAGRFLIVHRDHGWPHGWGDPPFDSSLISSLTNGILQPIVWSVNCASGLFDNETAAGDYGTTAGDVYFAERLLRKGDGGAVGMLGDTRNSPSWPNTALTRGYFDAVWPNALPAYGGGTSHRRLGDILNYGKYYMVSQIGVPGAGVSASDSTSELNMWHALGDPTLEMWTRRPLRINPSILVNLLSASLIKLDYDEDGAEVTALQPIDCDPLGPCEENWKPVGRGIVANGKVDIQSFFKGSSDFDPKLPLLLTACKNDGICELLKRIDPPKPTVTPTLVPTVTPSPTNTPVPTKVPTPTLTPVPPTKTPTPTPTKEQPKPTNTPTPTPSRSPNEGPTLTPTKPPILN